MKVFSFRCLPSKKKEGQQPVCLLPTSPDTREGQKRSQRSVLPCWLLPPKLSSVDLKDLAGQEMEQDHSSSPCPPHHLTLLPSTRPCANTLSPISLCSMTYTAHSLSLTNPLRIAWSYSRPHTQALSSKTGMKGSSFHSASVTCSFRH